MALRHKTRLLLDRLLGIDAPLAVRLGQLEHKIDSVQGSISRLADRVEVLVARMDALSQRGVPASSALLLQRAEQQAVAVADIEALLLRQAALLSRIEIALCHMQPERTCARVFAEAGPARAPRPPGRGPTGPDEWLGQPTPGDE